VAYYRENPNILIGHDPQKIQCLIQINRRGHLANPNRRKTMKYVIEINCDNDSFEDHPAWEVKRILKVLVEKMHGEYDPPDFLTLYDMNGNAVGTAVYSECSIT